MEQKGINNNNNDYPSQLKQFKDDSFNFRYSII